MKNTKSTTKTYSIFGAGAAGLYTAWRLLDGKAEKPKDSKKLLTSGDTLELFDWGEYDFSKKHPGTRAAGARVCTWHYQEDKNNSFLELGGMRYSYWNGKKNAAGHRLVTKTIEELGLDKFSVPFNESNDPLLYLRQKNMYLNDINSNNPAPYNTDNSENAVPPDNGFNVIEELAVNSDLTRSEWCDFYRNGVITEQLSENSVFQTGNRLRDIGYWNLMYDQLGSEGYNYSADGNGYSSNVINWNAAEAIQANNEFTPGTEYKTLTRGYSDIFNTLFTTIEKMAAKKGVNFVYKPNVRLHSILEKGGTINYTIAKRKKPNKAAGSGKTDAAWLAMPRHSVELVAQATRYIDHNGTDVLNHEKVQNYLEAVIIQPSYKIGMFFDTQWWLDGANYPSKLESYIVTKDVITKLMREGFPAKYLKVLSSKEILEVSIEAKADFINTVEQAIGKRLTLEQENMLVAAAERNTIGPSVTDLPVRQVVYFGNNATDQNSNKQPIYGILASYDDERFDTFWRELELGPHEDRTTAPSQDYQPLDGPRTAPPIMVKMLRQQLAKIHYGPQANYKAVPEPLETRYMDWSLPPFKGGYHAYAAHYDIGDVQQKIRKPSQLIKGADANIFIVGSTYSNDQAWVEGAFCTAESVLNDFFGVKPIIDPKPYPFICPA